MTCNQLTPCTTGMENVCACSRHVLMPYELIIYVSTADTIFIKAVFRGNSPIYYRQRIGKQAFANILPLQYFATYGTLLNLALQDYRLKQMSICHHSCFAM